MGSPRVGDWFRHRLFMLLHELAHLTLGHITPQTQTMVDTDVVGDQVDSIERGSERPGQDRLFPDGFEPEAVSAEDLERIAARYGVHRASSSVRSSVTQETGDGNRHRIPKV